MEKTVKIRSSFLSTMNEALQKLKLNDTVKEFTPVIVEADGKFSSIVKTDSDFNPSTPGLEIDTLDNESEEAKETKEQLVNQAKDTLKQTLTASSKLNDILEKMKKLSQDKDNNTWQVNKQGNTASLENKNAQIFKQNDYLCLSHSGKIELFKSVSELRDWLKEHNYPLPDESIVIHESVDMKEEESEGRNWYDLLIANKANSNPEPSKSRILDDKTKSKWSKIINDYDKDYYDNIISTANLSDEKHTLEAKLSWLEKYVNKLSEKRALTGVLPDPEEERNYQDKSDDLEETKERLKELNTILAEKNKQSLEFKKNNVERSDEVYNLRRELVADKQLRDKLDKEEDLLQQGVGKAINKQDYQFLSKQKEPEKIGKMPGAKYDEEIEECGVGTATANLGSAVAYVGNKEKTEETEIDEAFNYTPDGKGGYDPAGIRAQRGKAVNAFLAWLKHNEQKIRDGEIILPDDFLTKWDEIKSTFFQYNIADEGGRKYKGLLDYLSQDYARKLLQTEDPMFNALDVNKQKEAIKARALEIQENPDKKFIDIFNKNMADNLEDGHKFVPRVSLSDTNDGSNVNYKLRKEWEKNKLDELYQTDAKVQAKFKHFHAVEDMIKKMSAKGFKGFEKDPLPGFSDEEKAILKKKKVDINDYSPEELHGIAKLFMKKKTESVIFESAEKHPWLSKVLGQRLTEDDSPADFATGSPISSDMDSSDLSSTTTSSTTTTDIPDVDLGTSDFTDKKDFGDIDVNVRGDYSPDEQEDIDIQLPNMPEYEIIDVLMDDDNPDDIKVKVQDIDTKKTEMKNLEDIDV